MIRLFATKAAPILTKSVSALAERLAKSSQALCKELGVTSISGPLLIVERVKPGEKNVVSAAKFYSLVKVATPEEMTANAKLLEDAHKSGPSW